MAAHERIKAQDQDGDALHTNRAHELSKEQHLETGLDDGLTRLGTWGEVGLVFGLVLTVLYLFAFSHSKSQFSRQLKLSERGWPQPRHESRNWAQQHALYAAMAAKDEAELIFYGDSVFELWRGTVHMEPDPRGHGVPEVFHDNFGHAYKAAAFAISGDTTSHLMWRLLNGEAPTPLHSARVAVVLIGSNDLAYASFQAVQCKQTISKLCIHCNEGDAHIPLAGNATASRILAIADHICAAAPAATVLMMGLLPRGDQTLMPDPSMFAQPSKFAPTIASINARLQAHAAHNKRLRYLDCGAALLSPDHTALQKSLVPDAVHPNAAGMKLIAGCLKPAIQAAAGH